MFHFSVMTQHVGVTLASAAAGCCVSLVSRSIDSLTLVSRALKHSFVDRSTNPCDSRVVYGHENVEASRLTCRKPQVGEIKLSTFRTGKHNSEQTKH